MWSHDHIAQSREHAEHITIEIPLIPLVNMDCLMIERPFFSGNNIHISFFQSESWRKVCWSKGQTKSWYGLYSYCSLNAFSVTL